MSITDARTRLSQIVDDAERTHARYEITRNGHPAAVLLGAEDFDSMQETIAVLSDQELLTSHVQGLLELADGDVLDADELADAIRRDGMCGQA